MKEMMEMAATMGLGVLVSAAVAGLSYFHMEGFFDHKILDYFFGPEPEFST